MTKAQFLEKVQNLRSYWPLYGGQLGATCFSIRNYIGPAYEEHFHDTFFAPYSESVLWTCEKEFDYFSSSLPPNSTVRTDRINSYRIILFELWVLYCLDEKLYKEF